MRQRYTRLRGLEALEELTAELTRRFQHREEQEIARLQQVLALVTHEGCLTNELVGYFGEKHAEPCGHCSYCVTGRANVLPSPHALPPLPQGFDDETFLALHAAHPDALGDARQAARFLCGLTSPALTRARLSRHELFGALETRRFREVLDWCASVFMAR